MVSGQDLHLPCLLPSCVPLATPQVKSAQHLSRSEWLLLLISEDCNGSVAATPEPLAARDAATHRPLALTRRPVARSPALLAKKTKVQWRVFRTDESTDGASLQRSMAHGLRGREKSTSYLRDARRAQWRSACFFAVRSSILWPARWRNAGAGPGFGGCLARERQGAEPLRLCAADAAA